jgi:putative oxidoreductase
MATLGAFRLPCNIPTLECTDETVIFCERLCGLRRLFSSFARGVPGFGLLLMRLVAATALFTQAIARLHMEAAPKPNVIAIVTFALAALLLLGLWTPIAGALAMLLEIWSCFSHPPDIWIYILLGTLSAALALLGPGAWSIDARLFGWKRI